MIYSLLPNLINTISMNVKGDETPQCGGRQVPSTSH